MSILSRSYFHCEKAAFKHVEASLWPNGPSCPHCGGTDRIKQMDGIRTKPSKKNPEGVERFGVKKCYDCRGQFTVRKGTIFEESHLPMHKWLQAIYLMTSSKKGISSHQMARTLEIQVKSAWFLTHRIRAAMASGLFDMSPMGGEGMTVEADETYIGKKEDQTPPEARKGRPYISKKSGVQKMAVVSLVERVGRVRSFHVDNATKKSVTEIVWHNVSRQSALYTDESRLYNDVRPKFATSGMVKHSDGEYVRGDIHTNTVEGFYSIFKRGMKGVYQHCKEKHLHRYLAEYDFRYNNRVRLGVDDVERANIALLGVVGKRLTYRSAR